MGVNGNANSGVGGNGDISSQHENGAHLALCDGSVRYFVNTIDQEVLTKVCFRADAALIDLPQQ
jgi:hypothetical protein